MTLSSVLSLIVQFILIFYSKKSQLLYFLITKLPKSYHNQKAILLVIVMKKEPLKNQQIQLKFHKIARGNCLKTSINGHTQIQHKKKPQLNRQFDNQTKLNYKEIWKFCRQQQQPDFELFLFFQLITRRSVDF